jgi:hypothetical protein
MLLSDDMSIPAIEVSVAVESALAAVSLLLPELHEINPINKIAGIAIIFFIIFKIKKLQNEVNISDFGEFKNLNPKYSYQKLKPG